MIDYNLLKNAPGLSRLEAVLKIKEWFKEHTGRFNVIDNGKHLIIKRLYR